MGYKSGHPTNYIIPESSGTEETKEATYLIFSELKIFDFAFTIDGARKKAEELLSKYPQAKFFVAKISSTHYNKITYTPTMETVK